MNEVTVVIATRNRAADLVGTLTRLAELPERPGVVVVDNASEDETARTVRTEFPGVRLVSLPENIGAAARNVGAQCAQSPYIAFSDDDSWWAPGALARAVDVLAADRDLAVVAARTVIEPSGRPDPVNRLMADSPLPRRPDRGAGHPPVLGFLACAAVVRRDAFFDVGGFNEMLFLGGEERLLAYDLAAAGWDLAYVDSVVAHHAPSAVRDPGWRSMLDQRNEALIGWLRRPWPHALGLTRRLARRAAADPVARAALASLLALVPRALRERQPLPPHIEAKVRLLDAEAPFDGETPFGEIAFDDESLFGDSAALDNIIRFGEVAPDVEPGFAYGEGKPEARG